MGEREAFYDQHIFPLMDRVIELAREAGIPFVASFQLEEESVDSERLPLQCTTFILPERAMARLIQARRILMNDYWDEILQADENC